MSADHFDPEVLKESLGPELSRLQELAQQARATQALKNSPWDSLTVEQKLERMRQIVKDLELTLRWHSNRFQEFSERLDALSEHGHAQGKVMIPVLSRLPAGGYGTEEQENKIEGWF